MTGKQFTIHALDWSNPLAQPGDRNAEWPTRGTPLPGAVHCHVQCRALPGPRYGGWYRNRPRLFHDRGPLDSRDQHTRTLCEAADVEWSDTRTSQKTVGDETPLDHRYTGCPSSAQSIGLILTRKIETHVAHANEEFVMPIQKRSSRMTASAEGWARASFRRH